MEKLNFNLGYKEYTINGDENAVIRISTTDFGLIDRLNKMRNKAGDIVAELEKIKQSEDEEIILSAITTSGEKMRTLIDEVFGEGTSDNVFGSINCLSFAGGQPVALNFLDAIMPVIQADIEKEQKASDKRIKKYTETAKKFK